MSRSLVVNLARLGHCSSGLAIILDLCSLVCESWPLKWQDSISDILSISLWCVPCWGKATSLAPGDVTSNQWFRCSHSSDTNVVEYVYVKQCHIEQRWQAKNDWLTFPPIMMVQWRIIQACSWKPSLMDHDGPYVPLNHASRGNSTSRISGFLSHCQAT